MERRRGGEAAMVIASGSTTGNEDRKEPVMNRNRLFERRA
jgi:hypothetical protein